MVNVEPSSQTEAGSLPRPGTGADLQEFLENPGLIVRADAHSGVGHRDPDQAVVGRGPDNAEHGRWLSS
jgi:hypothetical protein